MFGYGTDYVCVAGFSDDAEDLQMRFGLLDISLRTLHAALAIPESLKYFVEHIGARCFESLVTLSSECARFCRGILYSVPSEVLTRWFCRL